MSRNRLGKIGYGAAVMDLAETILQRYGIKWPLRTSDGRGADTPTMSPDRRSDETERFNDTLRAQTHCPDFLHYPCEPRDRSGDADES